MWDYECKGCGKQFEAALSFGADVTCTLCGAVNETEYDEDWDPDTGEDFCYSWTTRVLDQGSAPLLQRKFRVYNPCGGG